MSFINL